MEFISFLLLWKLFYSSKGQESKSTSSPPWKPSSAVVRNMDTQCVSKSVRSCVFSQATTTLIKSDSAAETPIHSLPPFPEQPTLALSFAHAPPSTAVYYNSLMSFHSAFFCNNFYVHWSWIEWFFAEPASQSFPVPFKVTASQFFFSSALNNLG